MEQMTVSQYADAKVAEDLGNTIFSFNGAMYALISDGYDNDPSLILAKRIAWIGNPPAPATQPAPVGGEPMDLDKVGGVSSDVETTPDLSFKLPSEKAKDTDAKLDKAKKAAKKAKKTKKEKK